MKTTYIKPVVEFVSVDIDHSVLENSYQVEDESKKTIEKVDDLPDGWTVGAKPSSWGSIWEDDSYDEYDDYDWEP